MSDGFTSRFTDEEMAAIRKSLRDEARFGSEFLGRLKRVAKRIPVAEDLLAPAAHLLVERDAARAGESPGEPRGHAIREDRHLLRSLREVVEGHQAGLQPRRSWRCRAT